ncbi:MAG: N-6 DNA methylase [Bacteroidetes bacterium]|nr:N-6 DNA methylase [Bacteroidota bacterium]
MNLNIFNTAKLFDAATNLFQQLNIKLNSTTAEPLPVKDLLKQHYKDNDTFKAIDKTFFIGIIDDTVFKATGMFDINYSYKEAIEQGDKNYNGLMLFALELKKQPTRTEISDLTRNFNRISQKMPVALVLKYTVDKEAVISIAISERFKYLQNWRQGEKAGKVIILRDIHTQNTHAGHTRILLDLVKPVAVTNYDQLHQHWLQVLDVSILNKKFFQDLANWYFWAMDNVQFPDDLEKKKDVRNATNLIRLITRVIFIWFIKEKSLVPNALFRREYIDKILKDFNKSKKSQNYYNAILQNLFFGTLNQKMEERKFAKEGDIKTNKEEYGVKNLFRYADLFNIPEKEVLALFKDVPFLNGGLFDCLDKPNEENKIVYVDGFSRNPKKQASVPDCIFFGEEKEVDLNEIYGTRNKTYKSRGLINLLESYKFTVAENTPIEEEIALDPELLGKVFENLLASYNPETQTTARKQTGSFYTPREIVNYMVDESLLEYIKQNVKNDSKDFEIRLRDVFSYSENPNPFSEAETKDLIEAINNCKILDPACGSGAFPMGILHKMVHILQKLDAKNKLWKDLQRHKAIEETETAFNIGDKEERAKRLAEINDVFENNASDYGRKLYLIENCIYGIDIQPVAVQIAKLRFFISLVIDQKVNKNNPNFGVRSLPNLETKFVAANTLIGLEKPKQLTIRNPNIDEKEKEIKDLRHEYFTVNTRKEKLILQKRDKKLRLEIAALLKADGWHSKVAEQIASFDPYDQNTFASWFDSEWMFGLTSGFDIVIGNPPYVNVEQIDKTIKDNISKFRTAYQKYDLYVLFFEKGIDLLKENGQLNYITSNKFLSQGYGLLLRQEFLTYFIHQIVNFNYDIFEAATVRTCIFHLQKTKSSNASIKIIDVGSQKDSDKFSKLLFSYLNQVIFSNTEENNFRINLTNEKIEILDKIQKDSIRVEEIFSVNYGLRPSSEKLGLKKESFIFSNNPSRKYKKYFEGKDMGYWQIKASSYLDYQPDVMYNAMFPALFENPKLVGLRTLSDIGKLRFIYDDEKYYCNDSVVVLVLWHLFSNVQNQTIERNISKERIKTSKQFDYFFVQGILNSKLIKFYVNELLYDGTHFYPNHMKSLPIKNISSSGQKPIVKIVENIHTKLSNEANPDISKLEKQIDELVYKLYDLTEEEIKIIEGNE